MSHVPPPARWAGIRSRGAGTRQGLEAGRPVAPNEFGGAQLQGYGIIRLAKRQDASFLERELERCRPRCHA